MTYNYEGVWLLACKLAILQIVHTRIVYCFFSTEQFGSMQLPTSVPLTDYATVLLRTKYCTVL